MATNFEGYSHKELLAMLASVDGEKVKTRGQLLKDAEIEITKIGNDLKNHKVENWEGAAADAFQDWVNRLGNSTLRLGEYSKTGGEWMVNAAQTIAEVKANMPAYDQKAYDNLEASREARNDPDAQKIGQEAHSKLSGDRLDAVQQMNKLAQSYEASTTQINAAPVPTFPPAPETLVPTMVDGGTEISRSSGDPGQGYALREARYPTQTGDTRGPSPEPGWVPGHPPANQDPTTPSPVQPAPGPGPSPVTPVVPDRDVDLDLDHVATLPPPTTVSPVPPVAPGPGPSPVGPNPVVPVPPVTLPPISGRNMPGPSPVGPGRPPVTNLPGMPGPIGKVVGGPPGIPPRDSGIHGGRPVNTTGPSSGIPRGNVIGNEPHAQVGRQGAGYGPGMGGGGGFNGGGVQGAPGSGRRLAHEPGGVVGGRPIGGATGSTTGARPFTQGGSGLVRGNPGAGPVGAQVPGRRRDDENGERPDYLVEDEETWQDNRQVGRPVVD
ncbi:hypothetical protein [Streptomyces sp. NPDC051211]|uniref:hypothetical protein n=1 Tax=Streptomyces sp. NPDC051211 TaxID=3154643 RepID=UPI003450050D